MFLRKHQILFSNPTIHEWEQKFYKVIQKFSVCMAKRKDKGNVSGSQMCNVTEDLVVNCVALSVSDWFGIKLQVIDWIWREQK